MIIDFLRELEWERLLAAIIIRREGKGYNEAREEIEKACLRVTGLPFNLIRRYSPEALLDLMQRGAESSQKSIYLAELLIEYSKICDAEGKTADEIGSTLQAYCLLREAIGILPAKEEAIYRSKLNLLAKKLSVYGDNPYIQVRLAPRLDAKPKD